MRHITFMILFFAVAAEAQQRPNPEIHLTGGWVGFIDEDLLDHAAIGASFRYYLTRRVGIEPEVLYMIGPGADRDVSVIPNLSFDFRPGQQVRPYIIGGVGLLHHRDEFNFMKFTDNEWTVNGGVGVKVFLTPRVFVAPEFRLGFETTFRAGGSVGFAF
jgi:hypothetical protein